MQKKKTHKIIIENIRIYTNHGCLEEEKKIGSHYLVDVEMHTDMTKAAQTDALEDAIDYVAVNQIIQQEMAQRSKLLEHVVQRTLDRFETEFPLLSYVRLKVSKLNPPMGGNVEKVSIEFEQAY